MKEKERKREIEERECKGMKERKERIKKER